jgi:hypothetical protein
MACLEKEPEDRYASAEALADDLRRWLGGEPPRVKPVPWTRRAARSLKRNAVRIALAAVVFATLTAALIAWFRGEPETAAEQFDRVSSQQTEQLKRGESLTLIGGKGKPLTSRWVGAAGAVNPSPYPDDAFTINSMNSAALELLADQPLRAFKFSAEVRHNLGGPGSRVGIMMFRGETDLSGKREFTHWELSFNDHRHLGPRNIAFQWRRYGMGEDIGTAAYPAQKLPTPVFDYLRVVPPWNSFVVEVTPSRMRAALNGKTLLEMPPKQVAQHRREVHDFRPTPPALPHYPRGGLGLFVRAGSASFKNVEVSPLEVEGE